MRGVVVKVFILLLAILYVVFDQTIVVSAGESFPLQLLRLVGRNDQNNVIGWSRANKNYNVKNLEPEDLHAGGILWENLTVSTNNGKQTIILNPSSGFVPNGHVFGVIGPSGAGKSTFLSIIAGRTESSLELGGHVLYYCSDSNSSSVDSNGNCSFYCARVLPNSVAWLQQHDAFFERLTVKETLDLAVYLEWPQLPIAQRDNIARSCLDSLGLAKVKHRQIGSPDNSRTSSGATLSGGELRRLSVALELVTKPNLFIADEPTSGIDSKMAENVMRAISSLAKEQHIPCFCSLHQPRSSIWHMLDSFILLAPGGRICYIGSRQDSVAYFASLGYNCPNETNPGEFFIDLVSVDTENPIKATQDRERIDFLANSFDKHNRQTSTCLDAVRLATPLGILQYRKSLKQYSPRFSLRFIRRMGALFRRSWRQTIRSRGLNSLRLVISMGTALLLSQIFPSVLAKGPPTTKSVADRICLLSFSVITMFMIPLHKTIGVFAAEKPVVQRERKRNDYTSVEYILSKSLAETPLDVIFALVFATTLKVVTGLAIELKQLSIVLALITLSGSSLGFLLGSVTKSKEAAVAAAMPVLIILMVVGVINPSGVDANAASPLILHFIKYFSPIASAIEAVAVGEFSGMTFATSTYFLGIQRFRDLPRMGGLALVSNGDEALIALGLRGVEFDAVLSHLAILSVLNFGLCWLGLHNSNIRLERWNRKLRSFLSRRKQK